MNPEAGVTVTVVVPDEPAETVTVVGLTLNENDGVPTTWVTGEDVEPA